MAVEANPRFAISAAALAYEKKMQVVDLNGPADDRLSSGPSLIVFVSDGSLSIFQS